MNPLEAAARAVCALRHIDADDIDPLTDKPIWRVIDRESRAAIRAYLKACAEDDYRSLRHKYWAAGESDCPRDLKASNGELHTLQCKVCGEKSPQGLLCLSALEPKE